MPVDGSAQVFDRRTGFEVDRLVQRVQRELVMMQTVSGRRARAAEPVVAHSVPTLSDAGTVVATDPTARGIDAPCHPVDEGPAGRGRILTGQRELDHAARHTAPMELGRRVLTVAGMHTRYRVAFFEVRTGQVHRRLTVVLASRVGPTIGGFPVGGRTGRSS